MLDPSLRGISRQSADELAETIRQVRDMGLMVDNNNDALPENIPSINDPKPNYLDDKEDALQELNQSWGCSGIDERAKVGVESSKPKLKHGMELFAFESITCLQMFLFFFPK